MAPKKTYCLLRPHLDLVLSDMKPMIGSVIESNMRGANDTTPHIHPGKPKSWTNTTIKILMAAGNI